MDFSTAIRTCFDKFATFEGRAARPEFWWFALFGFLGNAVFGLVDAVLFGSADVNILGSLFSLAILLPSLAVGARRLHDTGRSGWWLLIGLIPVLGFLVLLYFFVLSGDEGANDYGSPP